MVSEHLCSTRL